MISNFDVALYFLSLDREHKFFNKILCTKNGKTFYKGNARLNIYMHLAQNIYIAKYQKPLIDSAFFAYDNGAVNPTIQENYSVLLEQSDKNIALPRMEKDFLDTIYKVFQNATLNEMIELSHEDSEWMDKHNFYQKKNQLMDSMSHKEEYAKQYADMIKIMERMQA